MTTRVPISWSVRIAVVLMLAFCGSLAVADDVLRCGDRLVNVGMVSSEVLAKCGEPQHKEVEDVPIRVRGQNGAVSSAGVTRVERWTYDRGAGAFPALLTFEEGKLKSLKLLTSR